MASAAKATKPEHAGIILWSVEKWTQLQTLYFHTLTVSKLAFSNDSNRLLGVSRDRTNAMECSLNLNLLVCMFVFLFLID